MLKYDVMIVAIQRWRVEVQARNKIDARERAIRVVRGLAPASTLTRRSAHFQVNPATWELTGRLLLDQPTETAML